MAGFSYYELLLISAVSAIKKKTNKTNCTIITKCYINMIS